MSHTLEIRVCRRLKRLAYSQDVSASAIIETALIQLYKSKTDKMIGQILREYGASRRRRSHNSSKGE